MAWMRWGYVSVITLVIVAYTKQASAEAWVVLKSQVPSIDGGSIVQSSDKLSLSNGQSLRLLGEDGTDLTIKGPYKGTVASKVGPRPKSKSRTAGTTSSSGGSAPLVRAGQLTQVLVPIVGDEGTRSVDLYIQFAVNASYLTPSAREQLDELGKAMNGDELQGNQFEINGHTDASGKASLNLALSKRRAGAVKAYLIRTFRIAPSMLVAQGFGESQLINTNDPKSAENRRVEILNLTKANEASGGWKSLN